MFVQHNTVETRKKLKWTNRIRQHIKYRNKNELFMSWNFTPKVVKKIAILWQR